MCKLHIFCFTDRSQPIQVVTESLFNSSCTALSHNLDTPGNSCLCVCYMLPKVCVFIFLLVKLAAFQCLTGRTIKATVVLYFLTFLNHPHDGQIFPIINKRWTIQQWFDLDWSNQPCPCFVFVCYLFIYLLRDFFFFFWYWFHSIYLPTSLLVHLMSLSYMNH